MRQSGDRELRFHFVTAREQHDVEDQLHGERSAGVENDVLPAAGASGIERLVNLIEAGHNGGSDDPQHSPAQLPEVFASTHEGLRTIAPGGAHSAEDETTQDRIAEEVAGLTNEVVNEVKGMRVRTA